MELTLVEVAPGPAREQLCGESTVGITSGPARMRFGGKIGVRIAGLAGVGYVDIEMVFCGDMRVRITDAETAGSVRNASVGIAPAPARKILCGRIEE